MKLVLLVVVALAAFVSADDYHGFQVIRARASNLRQGHALVHLERTDDSLDFWRTPSLDDYTDIMVSPEKNKDIRAYLKFHGIPYSIMMEDVGKIVTEQAEAAAKQDHSVMNWVSYNRFDWISNWMDTIAAGNPNITVETFGSSYEGRPMKVVKFSRGGTGKPAIFIDAGIHAREWITPAAATWMMNELATNQNGQYNNLLDSIDWYWVPVLNPDGYEWTHTNTRLWRKTRSFHSTCYGVDANRNYDFMFNSCSGCSSGTCTSETYRGPRAFSEPETAAMANFILQKKAEGVNWQSYVSLHSYGHYFMLPWGYTQSRPADYDEMMDVARGVQSAIASHYGTNFAIGTSSNILYATDGSSADWAKGAAGIKWSYTAELRDNGRYGFVLPPDQIIPTSIETWSGMQVVARKIATL